MAEMPL